MPIESFPVKKAATRPEFQIPEAELSFATSRSGGAGGQNVNKVESKVQVSWNFLGTGTLSYQQKALLESKLKNRMNAAGEIFIQSQEERSQQANRAKAVAILNALVNKALTVLPKRKNTKVPKREKRKRLEAKRRHSEKKQLRKSFQ